MLIVRSDRRKGGKAKLSRILGEWYGLSDTREALMANVQSSGKREPNNRSKANCHFSIERHTRVAKRNPIARKPGFHLQEGESMCVVHGCFWHCCPSCFRMPRSNVGYWKAKISENVARDKKVSRKLRRMGYSVLIVWECKMGNAEVIARKISCRL